MTTNSAAPRSIMNSGRTVRLALAAILPAAMALGQTQDGAQDAADLLRRVQAKAAESVERLSRLMCTETVDRSQFKPAGVIVEDCGRAATETPQVQLEVSDRLRLDVAMGAAVEMYSWVGEEKFHDRSLSAIVSDGAISTGSFATLLSAVFQPGTATFTYKGDVVFEGQPVAEFGFEIPVERSRYVFGKGLDAVVTGFGGTFLVDHKTAEIVHIAEATRRLPSRTLACEAATTLDYARVRTKGFDTLLPRSSVLRITHTNGGLSENLMTFTDCHEFHATSRLTFEDPAELAAGRAARNERLEVPAGLRFRVAFTEAVDTSKAAGGDPLKARLESPIVVGGRVLVGKGANVAARIIRLRQYYSPSPAVELEVKLERVEIKGRWMDLDARPEYSMAFDGKKKRPEITRRVEIGVLGNLQRRAAPFVFRNVKIPYVMAKGLESTWLSGE